MLFSSSCSEQWCEKHNSTTRIFVKQFCIWEASQLCFDRSYTAAEELILVEAGQHKVIALTNNFARINVPKEELKFLGWGDGAIPKHLRDLFDDFCDSSSLGMRCVKDIVIHRKLVTSLQKTRTRVLSPSVQAQWNRTCRSHFPRRHRTVSSTSQKSKSTKKLIHQIYHTTGTWRQLDP